MTGWRKSYGMRRPLGRTRRLAGRSVAQARLLPAKPAFVCTGVRPVNESLSDIA
ncbi:hypothetical protein CPT_Paku_006 [Burkholderia phage Paku]|uniref:Uncharacterized protein n=1 Tax=Burkholderia phage Paku TaxID=2859650 RepID=A0AAE7WNH7_9CAUD|nr:hypothetical protein CPT_Paku_006 [Burkholderia phage Paku]